MTAAPAADRVSIPTAESLFRAVGQLAILLRKLEGRQRLVLDTPVAPATVELLVRCLRKAGAADVAVVDSPVGRLTSFEVLLSKRMSAALSAGLEVAPDALCAMEAFDFEPPLPRGRRQLLDARDGIRLSTYAAIAPGKPPVVLVLPCGMPFQLCQAWFDTLSTDYSVLTWETRGLFGEVADFERAGAGVDSQLADLFGLLDHYRISGAHLMGLCGGAVLAMRAAETQPRRFGSMSLWYGDYHLADGSLRTAHQKNFDWLMSEAGQARSEARELHQMFLDPAILSTVPEEIAHWALYPYANPELLYRYAKLNAFLNEEDVTASLPGLGIATLVVAGDCDTTTHSGASEFVATHLPQARFALERNGNHQKFFGAPEASRALALRFIAEQFA